MKLHENDQWLLYLLAVLAFAIIATFTCEVRAQDVADIRDFKGLVTNSDAEDLPPEYATILQNFKQGNGRLEKTFGAGEYKKAITYTGWTTYGIFTYVQDNLTIDSDDSGRVYMAYLVNDTTNIVRLYFYRGSPFNTWTTSNDLLENTLPTVYHKQDYNPIIQDGGAVRVLPGNVGEADGTNESKGLWLGYIARDYFGGAYAPDTGFYAYDTELDPPDFSSSGLNAIIETTEIGGLTQSAGTYYYKATYIYDGVQESGPSELFSVILSADSFLRLRFSITKESHPLRVTAMNIYRSSISDSIGSYSLMEVIDFVGSTGSVDAGDSSAYSLKWFASIPDFGSIPSDALEVWTKIDGQGISIRDSSELTNPPLFGPQGAASNGFLFDEDWSLLSAVSYYDPYYKFASGEDNAYNGSEVVYIQNESWPEHSLVGDILLYFNESDPTANVILRNKGAAIQIKESMDFNSEDINKPWRILKSRNGTYYTEDNLFSEFKILTTAADTLNHKGFYLPSPDTTYSVWFDAVTDSAYSEFSVTADSSDSLGEKYMLVPYRETEYGTYAAVWFDAGSGQNPAPAWPKQIRVSVESTFTDVQIGSSMAYSMDTSSEWSASALLNVVTVTCSLPGSTPGITSLTTGFSVDTVTIGHVINDYEWPFDSTKAAMRVPIDSNFTTAQVGSVLSYTVDNNVHFDAEVDSNIVNIACTDTGATGKAFSPDSLFTGFDISTVAIGLSGDKINYTFYDPGLANGSTYPLDGEVSIKMNGKFAQVANDRLFVANIVLDPGTTNEVRTNWLGYSELGQLDVLPVSNVISVYDRQGGPITGLSELYGNPVIMMKYSMSVLNIKDYPADPSRWRFIHSVHNIGNISPRGYMSVHGDIYPVAVDGIYRMSPNNLAETDRTPTENLRITEAIQDVYDNLTYSQKENIIAEYNQYEQEIIYYWADASYAFNIESGEWRELVTGLTPTIMAVDEQANVMIFDSSDQKVYSTGEKSSVGSAWQTPTFVVDDYNNLDLKYLYMTYKSTSCSLMAETFVNNSVTAKETLWFPDTTITSTYRRKVRARGQKFRVKISTHNDSATDTVKIDKVKLTR